MAYTRSNKAGQLQVTPGTTGAANAGGVYMPNSGTSVIGNTTTEVFTLAAPVQGCKKRIIVTSLTTTVAPVIRFSTSSGAGTVSLVGATTGNNLLTILGTRSTFCATVMDLEGFNSTSWLLTNVCPASSTATVSSVVTVSSGA